MIKKMILSLLLVYSCGQLNAQENPVKITRKVNADRSVDLEFEKPDPGSYTIVLKFGDISNFNSSDQEQIGIKNYSGTVYTAKPENKDRQVNFSYTYYTFRGKLNPKYNADFVYILPYKSGTKVRVAEAGYLYTTYFGTTTPEDWKVYRFYTQDEQPVVAVRKGIIVDVKDLYETESANEASYTSKTNELTVEHADGTLATYKGFKKGSISVKVGETVFPSTVLGMNSKTNSNSRYGILLSTIYLKSADIDARKKGVKESKSIYGFVTPKFFTAADPGAILAAQQEYTAADSPEVLQKELSKKELKKLQKQ
ncbi:hypothetical protein [Pedobacter sp. MC2016-24]|uniref:hypothetical protein n=1 Tax=Pedobacter sp. MC2016-24 TaxID=2780090 RepID=UPI001880AA0C|nr:hypothetical protein [Pedobacter sp. MC2016-24]MBE9599736.1 hypothetical protein [Pedobacter sp. MC2016-24]